MKAGKARAIYLSWSPLQRDFTEMVNSFHLGFKVFFFTSVLCVNVNLRK